MTEWRHVERFSKGWPGDCTTPTPDRASPCGYDVLGGYGGEHSPCGDTADPHDWNHPYQPTRCVCGHSIEVKP